MQIVAGGNHTCALMVDGNVKCFGRNNVGQLGYGHTDTIGDDETLDSVGYVSLGGKAIELSAGLQHTCTLLDDGSVKCWGDNIRGQLGLGNMDLIEDNEVPSDIAAINFGVSNKVRKIYSGTRYNCALFDNKKVKCWGENTRGQLGYGNVNHIGNDESLSSVGFVNIGDDESIFGVSRVMLNTTVSQVTAGTNHTCALTKDEGKVICWGLNSFGQLGYEDTNKVGDNESPSGFVAGLTPAP